MARHWAPYSQLIDTQTSSLNPNNQDTDTQIQFNSNYNRYSIPQQTQALPFQTPAQTFQYADTQQPLQYHGLPYSQSQRFGYVETNDSYNTATQPTQGQANFASYDFYSNTYKPNGKISRYPSASGHVTIGNLVPTSLLALHNASTFQAFTYETQQNFHTSQPPDYSLKYHPYVDSTDEYPYQQNIPLPPTFERYQNSYHNSLYNVDPVDQFTQQHLQKEETKSGSPSLDAEELNHDYDIHFPAASLNRSSSNSPKNNTQRVDTQSLSTVSASTGASTTTVTEQETKISEKAGANFDYKKVVLASLGTQGSEGMHADGHGKGSMFVKLNLNNIKAKKDLNVLVDAENKNSTAGEKEFIDKVDKVEVKYKINKFKFNIDAPAFTVNTSSYQNPKAAEGNVFEQMNIVQIPIELKLRVLTKQPKQSLLQEDSYEGNAILTTLEEAQQFNTKTLLTSCISHRLYVIDFSHFEVGAGLSAKVENALESMVPNLVGISAEIWIVLNNLKPLSITASKGEQGRDALLAEEILLFVKKFNESVVGLGLYTLKVSIGCYYNGKRAGALLLHV